MSSVLSPMLLNKPDLNLQADNDFSPFPRRGWCSGGSSTCSSAGGTVRRVFSVAVVTLSSPADSVAVDPVRIQLSHNENRNKQLFIEKTLYETFTLVGGKGGLSPGTFSVAQRLKKQTDEIFPGAAEEARSSAAGRQHQPLPVFS